MRRKRMEWRAAAAGIVLLAVLPAIAVGPAAQSSAAAAEAETKPKGPVDQARVAKLIEQLGADDFFAREKAQAELGEIGVEAFDVLTEAADRLRDVEVAERLTYLLRTIRVEWVDKNDTAEVRNLLQNYEGMEQAGREKTIDDLARIPGTAALPALCRIVRFERSPQLSKRAAVRILEQKVAADADWTKRAASLEAGIAASPRPAAEWVRAHQLEKADPTAAVAALKKWTEVEEQVLRQYPHRTTTEIVMSLLRHQSNLYKTLNRPQEAVAALVRMIGLESDGTAVLMEVILALTEQKAWADLDHVVERYSDRIHAEPLLLYAVADAAVRQGKTDVAERYVVAARQLFEGDQRRHIYTAQELQRKGFADWSEQEYQASIRMGTPGHVLTLFAQFSLSEMLHDRLRDLDAAKILDDATKGMEIAIAQGLDFSDTRRGIEANRARAHYFYALHFERQKDTKEQVRHLLEGLGDDQYDAEILIALFKVTELDATVRDRVRRLIRESADEYRRQIREQSPDASDADTAYNQLAWLISNTEGDFQEALKASQKSLEIKPDSPGHLDTLGRCYFASGDVDNAIKTQRRAIELDPHSQQMKRQLAEFEAARAKKQAEK
jgi:tetratricopeptide (TPR) repeat protein